MTNMTKLIAAAALISASGAALAFGPAPMPAETANGLGCEIATKIQGNMLMLEGVVHAEDTANGTYSFAVKGGGAAGATNISQGGAFSANAGDSVTLGKMMLSVGGTYDVAFELDANGTVLDCYDAVGGRV